MDVCLFAETGLNNMKEVKMKMKMSLFFAFLLRQVRMYLGMIDTVFTSGTRKAVQVR